MPSPIVTVAALLLFSAIFRRLVNLLLGDPNSKRYPPGPKGHLLIDNALDVPISQPWYVYASWKQKYGDLIFLRALGQKLLVVNSHEDAIALFEKRSRIYSDRPYFSAVNMMGWDFNSSLFPYSDEWRLHRKLYQHFLRPTTSPKFQPIQRSKVHVFLKDLLRAPEHFTDQYRTLSSAIMMKILYDIEIAPSSTKDIFVEAAEGADLNLSKVLLPSAIFPNLFPLVRYIPPWIPVLGRLKMLVTDTQELTHTMLNLPFEIARKNSSPENCVSMRLVEESRNKGTNPNEELDIRQVCATAYSAGSDTTTAAIGTFFLAMITYPESQRKAQQEIDEVLGNRLPEYEDRGNLPYVEAVYREVMRWHPVVPLGLPHCPTVDDIYKGYFIPKGTIIFPNIWAMMHDENRFPNSHEFIPERFFNQDGQLKEIEDIANAPFGFGRRLCPGRHMANSTIWLTIASVLSAFNIQKAKDEFGNEIPVPLNYSEEFISHPEPFKCSITPRSEATKELICKAE